MNKTTPEEAKALARKQVQQRLMRLAREVDGLTWADRKCIGEAIALIDEVRGVDAEPVAWRRSVHHPEGGVRGYETTYQPRVADIWRAEGSHAEALYTRPAPSQPAALKDERCATCGENEPSTGACGTSDNDTRAFCKRQPAALVELPALPTWWLTVLDPMGLPVQVYRRQEMLAYAKAAIDEHLKDKVAMGMRIEELERLLKRWMDSEATKKLG